MNDTEKILKAANFMYESQGYADVPLVSKMSGIPAMVVENVLSQNGFKKSGIPTQYIKERA